MKRLIPLVIVSTIAIFCLAASSNTPPKAKHRRNASAESFGGYVTRPNNGKVIEIINAQTAISNDFIEVAAKSVSDNLNMPVIIANKKFLLGDKPTGKTAVIVALCDQDALPTMLLAAPEEGWAQINTKTLTADKPELGVVQKRITQEVWRALAYILGASDSSIPGCIMQPVKSIADLDKIPALVPSPEPYNKIITNAERLGMQYTPKIPYRIACQQGWAPLPTNDVQRAIWEQIKAEKDKKPSNPIKVNFDPKTAPKVGK